MANLLIFVEEWEWTRQGVGGSSPLVSTVKGQTMKVGWATGSPCGAGKNLRLGRRRRA